MAYRNILIHPVITETALELIEKENKITFLVRREATKNSIKEAVEKLYQVQVEKVTTLIRPDGKKKAYVKLAAENSAADLATKIGIF